MIFWRLRDLGLGRRGRERLGAAAGRCGARSAPRRRLHARRIGRRARGHAVLWVPPADVSAGGHGDRRSCHGHGRGRRCRAAVQVRATREAESRAGCGLRRGVLAISSGASGGSRAQAGQQWPRIAALPLPPCQPVGDRHRRASLQATGIRRTPCCAGADSAAAILPASRTCPARLGGMQAAALLAACSLLAHSHQGAGEIPLKTQSINSAACAA